jgi:[acyl-carrier-protein] S-malonyltransferase
VLGFSDALKLIQKRAEEMDKAGRINPGKMLAIIGPKNNQIKEIIDYVPGISIANINSDKQIILSGSIESIDASISYCKQEKIRSIPLPVSGAFHSSLMSPASDALLEIINQLNFKDAIMPIYQNYTALGSKDKDIIKYNLIKQVTSIVKWQETIKNMINENISNFIEIGPKKILTNLNKTISNNIKSTSFEDFVNDK